VTGYVGTPNHWSRFKRQWEKILGKYSVPYFHAKRFFGRDSTGERLDCYKGWSPEKAWSFLTELLFCIDQRRLSPIGGAVHVRSFNALNDKEKRFLTGGNVRNDGKWLTSGAPSTPYFIAMQYLIVDALKHGSSKNTEIHFLFDRQNVLETRAVQTYNEILDTTANQYTERLTGAEKLGRISFGESSKEPPLQAADLLTYGWYSFLSRGMEGLNDERHYATNHLTRKRDEIRIYNAEAFEIVLSKLSPEVRAALHAD